MNEMNNEGNNFNNQNIEQQNMNQNTVVEPVQQQYVPPVQEQPIQEQQQYIQPEQPVNNQEPPKKSNALVIILLLLVIGLAGFIVYDKVIKKEEPKEPVEEPTEQPAEEISKLVAFNKNQVTKKKDITENGTTYFEIITIKNSDLTVDIKLFAEKDKNGIEDEDGYDDKIVMHLYINGVKKDENVLQRYFRCKKADCEVIDQYHFDEIKGIWEENILKAIGTIKGDKNYLYLHIVRETSSLYIINEKGDIIDTSGIKFYEDFHDGFILLSKDCKTYAYGQEYNYETQIDKARMGGGFIKEDAIYNSVLSKYDNNDVVYVNEYKITFANDKMVKEKIGNCKVELYGEKTFDDDYEDM